MDVVSAAASVAALLDFTYKVGGWAVDSIKAKKELERLLDGLNRLDTIIKSIDKRHQDARPGDDWNESLLELVRTSGKLTAEGKYEPNPQQKSETALSKLYMILQELSIELSPAQGWKKYGKRLRYHWDKNKFDELLQEFAQCREEIRFILGQDDFKISKVIREDGRETLVQVSEIKSRMSAIEDYQNRQEERLVEQRNEAEKAKMEEWLSPLQFLARQEQIFEAAFGRGNWLFDSLPFRHWVKGKPWHLRLYGDAGSGKVRHISPGRY